MRKLYTLIISLFVIVLFSCASMELNNKDMFEVGVKIATGRILKSNDGLADKVYPVLTAIELAIDEEEIVELKVLDVYISKEISKLKLNYEESVIVNKFFSDMKYSIILFMGKNYPVTKPLERMICVKEIIGWMKDAVVFYMNRG